MSVFNGDTSVVPPIGFLGMLRWCWRQITSMRVALILLLLLALAAIPGSLFPQRRVDVRAVEQYLADSPRVGAVLDSLQMFDVYSSIWFSAIYLLLFISLVGCIIPRCKKYYRQLRFVSVRVPRNLSRMPYFTVLVPSGGGVEGYGRDVLGEKMLLVEKFLDSSGYRVGKDGFVVEDLAISSEKGFCKELGNLVFHISLLGLLVSVAISGIFGFRGQKVLVEGDTFVNSVADYDSFDEGVWFDSSSLVPYSLRLDSFSAVYDRNVSHLGQPLDFRAEVTVTEQGRDVEKVLRVNSPLSVGGTNVYLVANGYAPVVTVTDGNGEVAFSQPVVFITQDQMYTSVGVIKVPDARPEQLSFQGFFLPTAKVTSEGVSFSAFPELANPILTLDSYIGDLGLDSGVSQSVYRLDTASLRQLNGRDLPAGGISISPGQVYDLPDGAGSISFDGIYHYIAIDISYDPGSFPILVFSSIAFVSLGLALFVASKRRVWVRFRYLGVDGERVVLEVAGLSRGDNSFLGKDISRVVEFCISELGFEEKK